MKTEASLTVKDWADEDKPRERLINKGKKELSNAELIALLLRSGVPGKSAVDMAKEILLRYNNSLVTLSQLDYPQLSPIKGMGEAKATTLIAALELGRRMMGEVSENKEITVNSSHDLFRFMAPLIADLDHEEFWAIFLSNRNKVIHRQRIALGGMTQTTVDLRILFRTALEQKAVRIAVAHNHPSGNLTASTADKQLTSRIVDAGKTLGINLIDHIIIAIATSGQPDYFSFCDNGLI